jgi:hypothetical protein
MELGIRAPTTLAVLGFKDWEAVHIYKVFWWRSVHNSMEYLINYGQHYGAQDHFVELWRRYPNSPHNNWLWGLLRKREHLTHREASDCVLDFANLPLIETYMVAVPRFEVV